MNARDCRVAIEDTDRMSNRERTWQRSRKKKRGEAVAGLW